MKKQYPFKFNNKFYNDEEETVSIKLKDVVYHYIFTILSTSYLYKSKKHNNELPINLCFGRFFFENNSNIAAKDIIILPFGHATLLVFYNNKTILFDPVFKSSSFFLNRYSNNIDLNFLPLIDAVVYSHNHPDHYNKTDLLTILKHSPHVQIFAPLGFDDFLKKEKIFKNEIKTMTWWDECNILFDDIKLTSLPAIHWSQSGILDRNETLWSSWMLTAGGTNVFFAGDTAYGGHFKDIKKYFKKIDIACLPIAPYSPREIQIDSHMDVGQSFQAFLDLESSIFIPIHWGVFAYGDEPLKQPIESIMKLFFENNIIEKIQSTIINVPYIYRENN